MSAFNAVARRALQDHPELKKDILFVDAANDVYLAAPRTLAALHDDDDAQDELQKTIRLARRLQTSFAQSIPVDHTKTIQAIVFHPDKYPLFAPNNHAIDQIGTIDHELGHLLTPDLHHTKGENAADAYAILRHLQRYHGQKTDVDYAAWKRAMVFIMTGKTSHLTTFTIDAILIDRASADFISLTPAQTAALARGYARKHTPSRSQLSVLSTAFNAARCKRPGHDLFRRIANITLAADAHSHVFHLGARALLPVLNGYHTRLNGHTVVLTGPEWQHIQNRLTQKIAALPAQHPLRKITGLAHPGVAP